MKFLLIIMIAFLFIINGKLYAKETYSTMKLNEVLHIISSIKSNKTVTNSKQFSKITKWVNALANDVKILSGRDLTKVSKQFVNAQIYTLTNDVYTDKKDLRIDYGGEVNTLQNSFFLKIGHCELSFVSNSVVICTGDIDIAHSDNNIIIANGEIEISHDGSGPENLGSIIYTKKLVDISHSHSSAILFSPEIEISHVNHSYCINTGTFNASHGQCKSITTSTLTESSIEHNIPELKIKQPISKTLKSYTRKLAKNPIQVAEYFCQGIKQLNFDYSKNFLHTSLLEKFDKQTIGMKRRLQKEKKKNKILKKLKKWSCEKLNYTNKPLQNQAYVTVGGMGKIKLKKENNIWKITKF